MKRYVLLCGGTGARMADALIVAASAGVFPAETLEVLLADPDRRGVRSAGLAAAKMADYARVRTAMNAGSGPFAVQLSFRAWPQSLPEEAATLSALTADAEEDALLCQALLDEKAAQLDLHEGFHGRRMLGQIVFAGMLHEADQNPADALSCLADEMVRALEEGEEVRVVVAGSICGGTGAAGIPALCRYLRRRTEDRIRLGAVLIGPNTDEDDAAAAHEAIAAYADEGLCDTIGLLALPRAVRGSCPADYAQLTDWLAVYMMDVLLHRTEWLTGLFTVRAPEGPADWQMFGRSAERYRIAYGQLMKTAVAWQYGLGAAVEKRLEKPFFLRDGLLGWYAHFFRRLRGDTAEQLTLARSVSRLMRISLLWLGGVSKTLPLDMRHATVLGRVRAEAEAHYAELTTLASQLAVMDDDAQRGDSYADNQVYRHNDSQEAMEAENAIRRIDAVKKEVARRRNEQVALQRRMGGDALMAHLLEARDAAQAECEEIQARYEEAVRRIDHAETIASPEDQYRITDARTKLNRMTRHSLLLRSKFEFIQRDVEDAVRQGLRFDKPSIPASAAENGLFLPEIAEKLLLRDALTRQQVERLWPEMVCPRATVSCKQAMKVVRRAPVDREAPLMSLLHALLTVSMKEAGKEGRA